MNDILLSRLAALTPQEQRIMAGQKPDEAFYAAGKNFTRSSPRLIAFSTSDGVATPGQTGTFLS